MTPVAPLAGGQSKSSPPDKGDLGGFINIKKYSCTLREPADLSLVKG